MDEKLIIISYKGETLDSFVKPFSAIAMANYLAQNQLNLIEMLEFEAFLFLNVEFK